MARITMGEMSVRARPEEEQDAEREALERLRAQVEAIDTSALSAPMTPAALPTSEPTPPPDPEASSATAHTLDGDWSDATSEPGAREGIGASPNLHEADAEFDALRRLAQETRSPAPPPPPVQPAVPKDDGSALAGPPDMVIPFDEADADQNAPPSPLAAVTPDDSMEMGDDSPDALHAMQGRPEIAPLAPDDAEPLGDQGLGVMRSPQGAVESPDDRWSRLARGGDFRQETLPDDEPEAPDPLQALAESGAKGEPTTPAPMLDEGLPSEGDIAGARERDAFLGPLRHLQAGLRGALGRPHRAIDSESRDLETQRSTGLRDRLLAKGTQRREEQAAERQASTDARADRSLALGERRADQAASDSAERLSIQREGMEGLERSRDSATEAREGAEARRVADAAALTDEGSQASQSERLAFGIARRRLSQADGAEADRLLQSEGIDPEHATAQQLRRATDIIRTIGVRGRAGGTGTGGARLEAARAALRGRLDARGQDSSVVDSMDASHVQSALLRESGVRPETGIGDGEEILPGVHASIPLARGEGRALRDGFSGLSQNYAALGEMRRIASEHVGGGAWNPQARADAAGARSSLMGMVSALEHSGVVNEGAIPRIEEAIPDPSTASQAVLDTLDARVRSYERSIDQAVTTSLRARGVSPEGIREALRLAHGGDSRARAAPSRPTVETAPPSAGMVTVTRRADGVTRRMPASAARSLPTADYEVVP